MLGSIAVRMESNPVVGAGTSVCFEIDQQIEVVGDSRDLRRKIPAARVRRGSVFKGGTWAKVVRVRSRRSLTTERAKESSCADLVKKRNRSICRN